MSQYRIWIKADELMKRWGIGDLDLADYIVNGKLKAYHNDGHPIDLAFERKTFLERLEYYEEVCDDVKIWLPLLDLTPLHKKVIDFIFKYEEVINLEKRKRNLRPVQKHKEICRNIAETIWKNEPQLSIADVIKRDEIKNIRNIRDIVDEKKPYSEKTIRGWINDLCPIRKSGRRAKPK